MRFKSAKSSESPYKNELNKPTKNLTENFPTAFCHGECKNKVKDPSKDLTQSTGGGSNVEYYTTLTTFLLKTIAAGDKAKKFFADGRGTYQV